MYDRALIHECNAIKVMHAACQEQLPLLGSRHRMDCGIMHYGPRPITAALPLRLACTRQGGRFERAASRAVRTRLRRARGCLGRVYFVIGDVVVKLVGSENVAQTVALYLSASLRMFPVAETRRAVESGKQCAEIGVSGKVGHLRTDRLYAGNTAPQDAAT